MILVLQYLCLKVYGTQVDFPSLVDWMVAVANHTSACTHAEHQRFGASQQTMRSLNSE